MVYTYKQRFNKKYGFPKDEPHSLAEISKITGYKKAGLETIARKGAAEFFSNPASVRPNVKTPEQWKIARLYSAVMGGAAARIDAKHLIRNK